MRCIVCGIMIESDRPEWQVGQYRKVVDVKPVVFKARATSVTVLRVHLAKKRSTWDRNGEVKEEDSSGLSATVTSSISG
jgi:hypothetical protein